MQGKQEGSGAGGKDWTLVVQEWEAATDATQGSSSKGVTCWFI